MITVSIEVDQITIDRDGEKITDLGEVVGILKRLYDAAQSLYTVNVGLAKLEGSRLDYLTQFSTASKKAEAPKPP